MTKSPKPTAAEPAYKPLTVLDLRMAVYAYDRALLSLWRIEDDLKDLSTFESQMDLALYEASRDSEIPMETIRKAWLLYSRSEAIRAEGRIERSLNYEE